MHQHPRVADTEVDSVDHQRAAAPERPVHAEDGIEAVMGLRAVTTTEASAGTEAVPLAYAPRVVTPPGRVDLRAPAADVYCAAHPTARVEVAGEEHPAPVAAVADRNAWPGFD